ncbi:MAG: 8-oxo-dGTP diphosphatase MutT [Massiliimalia sp.]|jgi:8-oxo-dGTP diphosphatase
MSVIHVAAAIIQNDKGEILICQRGPGGACAHLWEFPGGKIEPGETPEQCVLRECKEELDITIQLTERYADFSYEYPQQKIEFTFFKAKLSQGELQQNVHENLKWVLPKDFENYPFCPADKDLVKQLQEQG